MLKNKFLESEDNDELFVNDKYEPDKFSKEENEWKHHPYEFNEDENEETHVLEKEKKDHGDYKEYEK